MTTHPSTRPSGNRFRRLPVMLLVIWAFVLALDWFGRFYHFRWQDRLMIRSIAATFTRGGARAMQDVVVPASRGGDLTTLTGIDSFNLDFEEEKPSSRLVTDEYGYRNPSPTDHRHYPILLAGDSYMLTAHPSELDFRHQLEVYSGLPVYNYAMAGRGPFVSLLRFFGERRFEQRPPRMIVWGLIEREIEGRPFFSIIYQVDRLLQQDAVSAGVSAGAPALPPRFAWGMLAPSSLRRTLPDTSLIGYTGRRAWNMLRYAALGIVTAEVLPSEPLPAGNRTLLYRHSLETMKMGPEQRRLDQVVSAIQHVRDVLRTMEVELCVVLIPEKEQIYRDWIPRRRDLDPRRLPESCLDALSDLLTRAEVTHVHVLPAFREAAANGIPLYWRDDTHWRPEGIGIAAALTWSVIQPWMEQP